jgi:hypothetical protein
MANISFKEQVDSKSKHLNLDEENVEDHLFIHLKLTGMRYM